jgi:hypothetical protein
MAIDFSANCNPTPECTLCTGDKADNIWFVPRAPGYPGRCILDELTYEEVYEVLRRVPRAKADLIRITNDPTLLQLAQTTQLARSPQDEADMVQKRLNRNTLPFYTLFRGNVGGDPGRGGPQRR